MTSIIGFVGYDSYDLILYLATVLTEMGQRVIVSDSSDLRALSLCIPSLEDWEDGPVEYFGIEFVQDLQEEPEDFDWLFIDFGWSGGEQEFQCDELYYVTDYKQHNMLGLLDHLVEYESVLGILLRDKIDSKVTAQSVASELGLEDLPEESLYEVNEQAPDLMAQMLCQHNSGIPIRMISENMKGFICDFLADYWDRKSVMNAIKTAARRK